MIGLLYETERCLDGLNLATDADGERYFRPVSKRRKSVRLLTTDLANPAVVQFANMGDNLLPFMSLYSTCEVYEDEDAEPAVTLEDGTPVDTGVAPYVYLDRVEANQRNLRQHLIDIGGPNPINAVDRLAQLHGIPLRSIVRLQDGKPQLLLKCDDLFDFLRMETALIALEGAKVVVCDHCKNIFLAGPGTGRRPHAVHCSDKCRVGATRARKKESQ